MIPLKMPDWVNSIRSIATLLIVLTFCKMAWYEKVDPKDFMLIVSLIMNFYFLSRKDNPGGTDGNK